jgi:hypothetical protein
MFANNQLNNCIPNMEPENNSKERIMIELEAEKRLLEPSLGKILLMDSPGVGLCFESLFVLFCASMGGCIAWVIEQIGILPEWMMPPFTIVLSVACAIAAVWTCVDSRRKYNRYCSLRDELEQLDSTGHDQEFVTDRRYLDGLNNIESWILGKPAPSLADMMAHPQRSAFLLPWWQLIGQPRWHLPAAVIAAFAMNAVAGFLLVALPSAASPLATILIAIALIPAIFVFFRHWMFRVTDFDLLQNQPASLRSLLTSESKASLYHTWLLLNRLKRKRLIDPDRMEPFETDFPTNKYLFSVFSPAAVFFPIQGLTVNSSKLLAALKVE